MNSSVQAGSGEMSSVSSFAFIFQSHTSNSKESKKAEKIPAFNIWMLFNAAFEVQGGW